MRMNKTRSIPCNSATNTNINVTKKYLESLSSDFREIMWENYISKSI